MMSEHILDLRKEDEKYFDDREAPKNFPEIMHKYGSIRELADKLEALNKTSWKDFLGKNDTRTN